MPSIVSVVVAFLSSVPTLQVTMPLPELGQKAHGLGFHGIELPVRPGFQVEPQNVGGACAPRLCESIRHSGIGSTESRPTKKFIGGLEAAATLRKKVPPPTLY